MWEQLDLKAPQVMWVLLDPRAQQVLTVLTVLIPLCLVPPVPQDQQVLPVAATPVWPAC